ncbi:MAG: hypothetical protein PHD54_12790, partial [Desulfuromonadaceae bacterium]|nr:hypothetical protein [Desulfuromonadaceae bacterium]
GRNREVCGQGIGWIYPEALQVICVARGPYEVYPVNDRQPGEKFSGIFVQAIRFTGHFTYNIPSPAPQY